MRLHRIVLNSRAGTAAEAFNGKGGLAGSGRWHIQGRPIIYTAAHASLAALEVLVHLQRTGQIEPFVLAAIDVPDTLIHPVPKLPSGWQKDHPYTQQLGDSWLKSNRSVAMLVPSAIIGDEQNCIINPSHPDFSAQWVDPVLKPFEFDARLIKP